MDKKFTKEDMKKFIDTAHPKRVGNALVELYNRQTLDEQVQARTGHNNGVGFNKLDAEILTNMAEWFKDKGFLTGKQVTLVRKKIRKYAGQLADIANSKIAMERAATEMDKYMEEAILEDELRANGIPA